MKPSYMWKKHLKTCLKCGREFEGTASAKYCLFCRDEMIMRTRK